MNVYFSKERESSLYMSKETISLELGKALPVCSVKDNSARKIKQNSNSGIRIVIVCMQKKHFSLSRAFFWCIQHINTCCYL